MPSGVVLWVLVWERGWALFRFRWIGAFLCLPYNIRLRLFEFGFTDLFGCLVQGSSVAGLSYHYPDGSLYWVCGWSVDWSESFAVWEEGRV